jgi:hypothetical protein
VIQKNLRTPSLIFYFIKLFSITFLFFISAKCFPPIYLPSGQWIDIIKIKLGKLFFSKEKPFLFHLYSFSIYLRFLFFFFPFPSLFLFYSFSIPFLFLFFFFPIPFLFLFYSFSIPFLFLFYSFSIPFLFLFYSYSFSFSFSFLFLSYSTFIREEQSIKVLTVSKIVLFFEKKISS